MDCNIAQAKREGEQHSAQCRSKAAGYDSGCPRCGISPTNAEIQDRTAAI